MKFFASLLFCFCGFLHVSSAETVNADFTTSSTVPFTAASYSANGKELDLSLSYAPTTGTHLTVVNNTGLSFISGQFSNLAQGQVVDLTYEGKSYSFVANYYGGSGNDLVLQWARQTLAAWGENDNGQLGDGTTTKSNVPVLVDQGGVLTDKSVLAISTGYSHSLALCSDGTLATWGYNGSGQLGDGTTTESSVPVRVNQSGVLTGKTIVAISAGDEHSLALCADGTLATWGANRFSQLGDGTTTASSVPVRVNQNGVLADKTVVAASAGASHTLILCSDGTMAAWGLNWSGQLGNGTTTESSVPVRVNQSGVLADKTVIAVSTGDSHSLALCSDGTLATWGYNFYGQLGDGTTTESSVPVRVNQSGVLAGKTVVAVAAGSYHSLALCSDGTLATWGYNRSGQLGDGSATTESKIPVRVNQGGILAGKTIVAISAGDEHSLALCSDGTLATWGANGSGQLGDGSNKENNIPVLINQSGVLSGKTVVAVSPGDSHSLALASYELSYFSLVLASSMNGDINGITIDGKYVSGTNATLTAIPQPGYLFSSWTGDASGSNNPTTVLMNSDKTVGASFVQDSGDTDADGLNNYRERVVHLTDPNKADTDGDGLRDADEINITQTNPLLVDSNANGLSDSFEDTDSDGILNGREVNEIGTHPLLTDSNGNGLSDTYEFIYKGDTDAFTPRIGDRIRLELQKLGFQGTYKLLGKLPTGLAFNPLTGIIEGKLTGKPLTSSLTIQVLNGTTMVRSISLVLPVTAYPVGLTGTWQALIYDSDDVPQGLLTTTFTAPGICSASLDLIGPNKPRTSLVTFKLSPGENKASFTINFPASTTQPSLQIALEADGDKAELEGSCSIGELSGFRLARGTELPTLTRSYTMLIDHGTHDGIAVPAGMGWATGMLSNKGTITLTGQLGDAKLVKASLRLGATGQAIMWLKPYLNKSSKIAGVLSFNDTGVIPSTSLTKNDSHLSWYRVADANELSYPAGFAAIPAEVLIKAYAVPTSAPMLAQNLGLVSQTFPKIEFNGAGLADLDNTFALPSTFVMDASYKLIAQPIPGRVMAPWLGAINTKIGSFTGTLSVKNPVGDILAGTLSASGVIFPADEETPSVGAGLVKIPVTGKVGAFRTGSVILER